ncbi:MAG: hypothetical protein KDI66_11750 [Xanthomonadales bacterium]|nr:hypothetical protein [Xanthomonadales bacterium]
MTERRPENATYLFDGRTSGVLPKSESFWTTVFALFLIHLGRPSTKHVDIGIWSPDGDKKPFHYRRFSKLVNSDFFNLTANELQVERRPGSILPAFLNDKVLNGTAPDLLVPISSRGWLLIENKTCEHQVATNSQKLNYPEIITRLRKNACTSRYLLLMSHGATKHFNQACELHNELKDAFGILLWEDVLRRMAETDFDILGISKQELNSYTLSASSECEDW